MAGRRSRRPDCEAFLPGCNDVGVGFDDVRCRRLSPPCLRAPGSTRPPPTPARTRSHQLPNGQSCGSDFSATSRRATSVRAPPGTKAAGESCENDGCMVPPGGMANCDRDVRTTSTSRSVSRSCAGSSARCVGDVKDGTLVWGTGPGIPGQVFICYADDGLHCDGTTCVALKRMGDTCATTDECMANTFCDDTVNQCAALKAMGDSCRVSTECQAGTFCSTLYLSPHENTCVPQIVLGDQCFDPSAVCTSGSCVYGRCEPPGIVNVAGLCRSVF